MSCKLLGRAHRSAVPEGALTRAPAQSAIPAEPGIGPLFMGHVVNGPMTQRGLADPSDPMTQRNPVKFNDDPSDPVKFNDPTRPSDPMGPSDPVLTQRSHMLIDRQSTPGSFVSSQS